jgi:hypothetical protein
MVGYVLYGVNFAIVIANTILDAVMQRAQTVPEWLLMYATFILPATPVLIGLGVAFIFLLDPSKKVHDARAAAEAASLDAMALHMREAANRPDVNAAIQVAAVKDMQDAAVRVTGVALPELPAPRKAAARKNANRVVMAADGSPAPRLARPRGKRASR